MIDNSFIIYYKIIDKDNNIYVPIGVINNVIDIDKANFSADFNILYSKSILNENFMIEIKKNKIDLYDTTKNQRIVNFIKIFIESFKIGCVDDILKLWRKFDWQPEIISRIENIYDFLLSSKKDKINVFDKDKNIYSISNLLILKDIWINKNEWYDNLYYLSIDMNMLRLKDLKSNNINFIPYKGKDYILNNEVIENYMNFLNDKKIIIKKDKDNNQYCLIEIYGGFLLEKEDRIEITKVGDISNLKEKYDVYQKNTFLQEKNIELKEKISKIKKIEEENNKLKKKIETTLILERENIFLKNEIKKLNLRYNIYINELKNQSEHYLQKINKLQEEIIQLYKNKNIIKESSDEDVIEIQKIPENAESVENVNKKRKKNWVEYEYPKNKKQK